MEYKSKGSYDNFEILKNRKIISIDVFDALCAITGLRNRIVHDYNGLVVPKGNLADVLDFLLKNLKHNRDKYDIRFFEELPLVIQGNILDLDILIYSPDAPELYEYLFFKARKDWNI